MRVRVSSFTCARPGMAKEKEDRELVLREDEGEGEENKR
jgi:hypothetical protein